MSKFASSWVVLLVAVACGGTTQTGDGGGGSTSGGGGSGNTSGSAGKDSGGSVSSAGSVSTGGSGVAGTVGTGGSVGVSGSTGTGGSTYDPRCPAMKPTGMCAPADNGAACQYNDLNGCLCYRSPVFMYPCAQVDTTCPNGGAGGAAASTPPPSGAGVGGISAKIALPPTQVCSCTSGNWSCSFGP